MLAVGAGAPGMTDVSVQQSLIDHCERLKDRFAILDIPQSKDIEWVRKWRRRTDSSYCSSGSSRTSVSCAAWATAASLLAFWLSGALVR